MACPYHPNPTGSTPETNNEESSAENHLEEIPQPRQQLFGLVGNLADIDPSFPAKSLWELSSLYGPIYKLRLKSDLVVLGSQKLVNEMGDEDRFEKNPSGVLAEVRALTKDGLFTAFPSEPNWWKAHRILVPVFGPMSIRKMFPEMLDISTQLVQKWERQGPDHMIDTSDDLTRLAFDTIGLCAFGYRFNEFYSDHPHPFAQQMADFLVESGKRGSRPGLVNQLYYRSEQDRQANVSKMHTLCDEIIAERKTNPKPDAPDLLNTMLYTDDPETGERLSAENIRHNLVTFLIAGHETTSGTLSFAYYNLLSNPDKLLKAQQEVDAVVGRNALELKHLPQLKYIDACIKETLRLSSPITSYAVRAKKDTTLLGKYAIPKDTNLLALLKVLHHDPEVWGDEADLFMPERMLDGKFESLPPGSWKPFGNGRRACIGRGFAEQEMIINLALVLQRFQLEMADPSYELQLKSTLTIKPDNFRMIARRRPGTILSEAPSAAAGSNEPHARTVASSNTEKVSLLILYGGNTGTCKAFSQEIQSQATERGLNAIVKSLDSGTEHLPTDMPVVIITASYEGKPPDNARKFVAWLEKLQDDGQKLPQGVSYAVFGVGNSDWARTFHRIPKLVDEKLKALGAKPLLDAGFTNAKSDLVGPFEDWCDDLWKVLKLGGDDKQAKESTELQVDIKPNPIKKVLGSDRISKGVVIRNQQLSIDAQGLVKRHMELVLPETAEYSAGDYLVVLPRNPPGTVSRVLRQFKLDGDDLITVSGSRKQFIPTEALPIEELLYTTVELSVPISTRQIDALIQQQPSAEDRASLEKLKENYEDTVIKKRISILDVLEEHPSVQLPFAAYLDMLPPLASRQYSISSSPLYLGSSSSTQTSARQQYHADSSKVLSITYDVLDSPLWSIPDKLRFHGVSSSYLASREIGNSVSCFVRTTNNPSFRLPKDSKTPVIMIAAGTGVAPMRAFLQERAAIAAAGQRDLGPALLFFGCRHPEQDFIYKDEFDQWEADGIVKIVPAFSRVAGYKYKYVHDAVWDEREELSRLWQDGAKILVCGRAHTIGQSAGKVIKDIWMQKTNRGQEEADKWLDEIQEVRYVSDVFG